MLSPSCTSLRLSIVIASWNGLPSLERCLRSLKGDGQAPGTEVIVVTNFDGTVSEILKSHFSGVQLLSLPANTTVPMLRKAGVLKSRGEIVVLAEDHCTF